MSRNTGANGPAEKSATVWVRSLEQHAFPTIGKVAVSEVTTDQVVAILEPLVAGGHIKLASDVRNRIERVLDFASARKWRTGDNPARSTGHIEHRVTLEREVQPRASVPYAEMPAVMAAIATKRDASRYGDALALLILTVARAGMVKQATWGQIEQHPVFGWVWNVVPKGMKGRMAFTIPLSGAAVLILRRQALERGISLSTANAPENRDKLIFTNEVGGALREFDRMMGKIGYGAYHAHGFRASYRTWAAEKLKVAEYGHEIVEQVLAHKIRDEAEAAYARCRSAGSTSRVDGGVGRGVWCGGDAQLVAG